MGELPILTPWHTVYRATRKLICSGAFGVQEIQSIRTLAGAITAALLDYYTNFQSGLSLRQVHVLGDDLFGIGRIIDYEKFRKCFLWSFDQIALTLKDDAVPLQSKSHFDFLGIDVINGDGSLEEDKLPCSFLIPIPIGPFINMQCVLSMEECRTGKFNPAFLHRLSVWANTIPWDMHTNETTSLFELMLSYIFSTGLYPPYPLKRHPENENDRSPDIGSLEICTPNWTFRVAIVLIFCQGSPDVLL